MTDKINDGGQAFPTHPILYSSADQANAQGMSLRAWIAGMVMPAIIEADGIQFVGRFDEHANMAVRQADALIAALERRP